VVVLTTCDGDGGGYGRRLGLQGGRERERDDRKLGGRRLHLFFFTFCTRISSCSGHEIHLYL